MDDTLRRLLRRQDNVLSREQALAAGFTNSAIRHNLTAGRRWQVVVPGVYAAFSGPLTERHRLRAAVLHAGEPSWLTGLSVCRLWELRYLPIRIPKVEVLVVEGRRVRAVSFVQVSRTSRPPEKTWWFEGFPTVPPARAVITAARSFVDLREVRALLCEPVQRGMVTPAALVDELAAGESAGSALPRRALADVAAGCRSAPECERRDLVRTSRILPDARWNQPLPGASGLVPDACWPEARLIVEIDSAEWHRLGDAPERTERRRARLAALGWLVIPVSPRRLREEPALVLREIESAYRAGLPRP